MAVRKYVGFNDKVIADHALGWEFSAIYLR